MDRSVRWTLHDRISQDACLCRQVATTRTLTETQEKEEEDEVVEEEKEPGSIDVRKDSKKFGGKMQMINITTRKFNDISFEIAGFATFSFGIFQLKNICVSVC